MLVNTATELQNISTNLAGTYALGSDIEAGGVPITPLGNISPTQFTGILDGFGGIGSNRTISNLTIAPTSGTTNVGLFGVIGAGGMVRNLNIDNASVTADPKTPPPGQFVGVVAGIKRRADHNVTSPTRLSMPTANQNGILAGGMVGQNGTCWSRRAYGTITNSSAQVNVTLGNASGLITSERRRRLGRQQPGDDREFVGERQRLGRQLRRRRRAGRPERRFQRQFSDCRPGMIRQLARHRQRHRRARGRRPGWLQQRQRTIEDSSRQRQRPGKPTAVGQLCGVQLHRCPCRRPGRAEQGLIYSTNDNAAAERVQHASPPAPLASPPAASAAVSSASTTAPSPSLSPPARSPAAPAWPIRRWACSATTPCWAA